MSQEGRKDSLLALMPIGVIKDVLPSGEDLGGLNQKPDLINLAKDPDQQGRLLKDLENPLGKQDELSNGHTPG